MQVFVVSMILCFMPYFSHAHSKVDSLGIRSPQIHGHSLALLIKVGDVARFTLVTNDMDSVSALYVVCDSLHLEGATLAIVSRAGCAITSIAKKEEIVGRDFWASNSIGLRKGDNGGFFILNGLWRNRILRGGAVRFILLTEADEMSAGLFRWEQ